MKSLLALTVAGTAQWLKYALKSFRESNNWQILVISDGVNKDIESLCISHGGMFCEKEEVKGLTDSWNFAMRFFRKHGFENCILVNDDVQFPERFSEDLLFGLEDYVLMGPLSNQAGDGKKQRIFDYYKGNVNEIEKVQRSLWAYAKNPYEEADYLNGFCFAFDRKIFNYAYDKDNVFNPSNVNVGQEIDLIGRIKEKGGKIAVCKTSYVFHLKARTLLGIGKERNRLWNKKE